MAQKTQENFAGQTFFVGLDVHKKQWTVAIRTQGILVQRMSMNPSPKELRRFLDRTYPGGTYQSVYEAGFCGFWIHQQLLEQGIENSVVHPPDVPPSDKERKGKNDRRDARKLSRELENRSLTGIAVPSEPEQHLRSLCRLRERHIRSLTRVKNRIKGHLHFYGVVPPAHQETRQWSGKCVQWLQDGGVFLATGDRVSASLCDRARRTSTPSGGDYAALTSVLSPARASGVDPLRDVCARHRGCAGSDPVYGTDDHGPLRHARPVGSVRRTGSLCHQFRRTRNRSWLDLSA